MTDPIPLRIVTEEPEINPDVVTALDTISARAVEGGVAEIAIVIATPDGDFETCWSSAHEALLLGATRLLHELNRALDE